ncbi:Dehydratase family [Phytophthora infestans]|uniref:Dehydratase family n=1 Tax=Phytophthora infestans TaxID=4787 RepID=A0A833STI2_PHYIN|nr:Dehydratase family [Phytophthora infestans]KAF4149192.1 Dehydratase family [Phytophthora infestans]
MASSSFTSSGWRPHCCRDKITVDAEKKCIDLVDVTAEELTEHMKEWVAPPLKATRGTMYKFIKNVKSASEGCATDE